MSVLPSFLVGSFAIAGFAFAAAPLIIHLLNRRRFRVVHWAAMEFLQDAVRRNRRILHLRDLILLTLRTLAVLLFGFALAQPYFASREAQFDGRQPLHAVILLDNSRSMDYVSLEGTLLDRAKAKASDFIKRLPDGSVVSVVPTCGSRYPLSPDPYASVEHALDALRRIEPVDRTASIRETLNAARKAAESAPLLAKRFVWLTDQQRANFQAVEQNELVDDLQIVNVCEEERTNTWIASLQIQDGVADTSTPATIVAIVRHEGAEPRNDLQVNLLVDGEPAGSATISVSPGGAREVVFQHTFSTQQPTPQRPATAIVTASLTPDRMPADDQRHLVAHVAAAAPVVFIDQYGADEEDALQQRFGETRSLRRLLAPRAPGSAAARQFVEVRHVKPTQVDRDLLADARLTIIAGVESPRDIAETLRQYVEQGGQLLIAAGADFSPADWTDLAWRDGQGVLPLPLAEQAVGATPDESSELKPYFIDFQSVQSHNFFQLPGNAEDDLRDLFAEPFFFKSVRPDWSDADRQQWRDAERQRQHDTLQNEWQRLNAPDNETLTPDSEQRWLAWGRRRPPIRDQAEIDEVADQRVRATEPIVLARFDNGNPMLIERRIGQGRVVMFTSGLVSAWSTIPKTNCFIVFDRILRDMLRDTFPARNFPVQNRVDVQLPPADQEVAVALRRPTEKGDAQTDEVVHSGFLDERETSFAALSRGPYLLTATTLAQDSDAIGEVLWQQAVAIQADPRESSLSEIPEADAVETFGDATRMLAASDTISLAGSQVQGQDLWWWLALVVLVLLIAEMAILSLPRFASRSAQDTASSTPEYQERAA